jgi:hypothetical protein
MTHPVRAACPASVPNVDSNCRCIYAPSMRPASDDGDEWTHLAPY